MATPDLRYPIGSFVWPKSLTPAERKAGIQTIADTPGLIRSAIQGLTDSQLDTPYRPDGWTVRQVVHHVPDSHLNAYTRFKLALTEENPTIKPYNEGAWAELEDSRSRLIDASLSMLEGLHARWVFLLERMTPEHFERRLKHPEHDRVITLDMLLAMYAWHGRHHTAHITELRSRSGW